MIERHCVYFYVACLLACFPHWVECQLLCCAIHRHRRQSWIYCPILYCSLQIQQHKKRCPRQVPTRYAVVHIIIRISIRHKRQTWIINRNPSVEYLHSLLHAPLSALLSRIQHRLLYEQDARLFLDVFDVWWPQPWTFWPENELNSSMLSVTFTPI